MAQARKRGFFRRVAAGWIVGVTQFDMFVSVGSLLCAALLTTTVWRIANPPAVPHPSVNQACAPGAAELAKLQGRPAWTVGHAAATPMTARPGYQRRSRMLFPFTPLVVRGSAGGSLLVTAALPRGEFATGYVPQDRVQFTNPIAAAVSETGWLRVTAPGGTGLRVGPDLESSFYGKAAQGEKLRELGRIHMGWLTDTRPSDWYLVEQQNGHGCTYGAWVAMWQAKRFAGP